MSLNWIRNHRTRLFVVLIPALCLLSACSSDSDDGGFTPAPNPYPAADTIVSEIALNSSAASYVADVMPDGDGTGPTLLGSNQYVSGGSVILEVTTEDTATELLIGLNNTSSGHWTVDLGAAKNNLARARAIVSSENPFGLSKIGMSKMTAGGTVAHSTVVAPVTYILTITPDPEASQRSFTLRVATSDGTNITNVTTHGVSMNGTAAGSNFIQASLNWSHPIDMDLHLENPEGVDIYWAARSDGSGGMLDLDSNAGCFIDNVNNENITWPNAAPAAGLYTLRVNLWSACEESGPFPYLVTMTVGGEPTIYRGTMTVADAFAGGSHDGTIITTVQYNPAQ